MDATKTSRRSVDMRKAHFWKESVERENMLRLKWFTANEQLFTGHLNEPKMHAVPDDVKEEIHKSRQEYHLNKEYFPVKRTGEPEPPLVDPNAVNQVMRPIDTNIKKIIYEDSHENRVRYLRERIKLIPEKRYYFPETSSFKYGWNMWESAKSKPNYGFGRCQIIQQSFYRRRGVDKDPEWYKSPEKLSPTVCGCL